MVSSAVRTFTSGHSEPRVPFDCVRLVFVRDGTLILDTGRARPAFATPGDTVLVAAGAPFGYRAEAAVMTTTLLIDTDYLIEHLFWRYLDLIPDRDAARELAVKLYPDPIQLVRLGEQGIERLAPTLDELGTLTETHQDAAVYFRTHALLLTTLEVIVPHLRHAPIEMPLLTARERATHVASPRWRAFRPVRQEAAQVAELLHHRLAERWRVKDLAAHACLSSSQLRRVFKDSFGVSPMTYLSILRAQEMARLIRETNEPIATISTRVGWAPQDGQASTIFRRYMGTSPSNYRRHGPPSTSPEGPGIGTIPARTHNADSRSG